jgi:hypothetical protein
MSGDKKSTRTLGSREYLRYYRQKPRPSAANNIAVTAELAARFVILKPALYFLFNAVGKHVKYHFSKSLSPGNMDEYLNFSGTGAWVWPLSNQGSKL